MTAATPLHERPSPLRIADAAALRARVGAEALVSDWVEVDQARVDRFADATDDHQWIHVDPERARRESPFGGPIAHGFLTLSLIPSLLARVVQMERGMTVNYGLNRVRFAAPVLVGSRLRACFIVAEAIDVADGAVQVAWDVTVEIDGGAKPACIAQFVTRHYF
ncbi:MaoC family dehydratase [Trinickia dinghuensis]|uniref:MaoC family dehydratase n=1 Tax=Trinickia dinghuensis TaxID=2291023 RepID=A0A3D8JTK4_9BURK|nr:MaoC family dehydratase [Trinickia dinghuensis]RDU96407.1 MaoC family dehydratase [Trinickia dinghuensis]